MLNKLQAFIRQQNMIEAGDRVVCAVSGGADSMALLFAMYLLKEKLQIQLAAAHFNHGLRFAESDRDEAFVRDFCAGYGIEFVSGGTQVTAGKKGLEASAREARYAFLQSLPGKIATAHTADDNAETVLMHLVRGTGLKGLGGITPVRDQLIRPMLGVTRQEVLAFLQEYSVDYVTDSSNGTDDFLRNRLRHHVMPLLKQENPRLAENMSAMALQLRQDEQALEALAGQTPVTVSGLKEMAPALQSRALAAFLKDSGVKEPERSHIAQVRSLLYSANPSAMAQLPGGITIRRSYDALTVQQQTEAWVPVALPVPGCAEVNGYRITADYTDHRYQQTDHFTVCPRGTLYLRSRQAGDTMALTGGTKSLKKIWIDRKIPAQSRMQIPVLADDQGVLAVCGIGANLNRICETGVEIKIKKTEKEMGGLRNMHQDIKEILLTEEQIQSKICELARQLSEDYAGKNPVFIGVLKGVVLFFSDMMKRIDIPCQIDFMWISSYGHGTDAGQIVLKRDVGENLTGRHVVVLEDIFDTGNSLQFTYEHLMSKNPASVKICTLLDKPERRRAGVTVKPEYTGFVIPNEFVVGYGLDYAEYYRNLPYIGILKPEVYNK